MPGEFPLPQANPGELNFLPKPLHQLDRLIRQHIDEGRYPGCQIALARHGKLALCRTYGDARVEPNRVAADDDTLWLLFSNTKVLTMAAVWSLAEDGLLSFHDRVADWLPEFAAHGKGEITLFQVATHQAGFPSANVSRESWTDHARMRAEVCGFEPEWPAEAKLQYHGRSAHLTLAMVIEAATGRDYRDVIRERVIAPLGIADELFVGVPRSEHIAAPTSTPRPTTSGATTAPSSARPGCRMAAALGRRGDGRLLPDDARPWPARRGAGVFAADDRIRDARLHRRPARRGDGRHPDHRGLGPHVRGKGPRIRGLGSIASPWTFGHGGVGTSYCWADPSSGVSFAYLTNYLQPDPWHSARLDRISNLVHAAID